MDDVIVLGAGPVGLALAAALCDAGLTVTGVAPGRPDDALAPIPTASGRTNFRPPNSWRC